MADNPDEVLFQVGVILNDYLEKQIPTPEEAVSKMRVVLEKDNASEAMILHDMLITMVHNTPGRIVSISPESHLQEGQGDQYDGHELRFRIKDDVVEAFCRDCLVPREV